MVKTDLILIEKRTGKKFDIYEDKGDLFIKNGKLRTRAYNLLNKGFKVVSK